MSKGINGRNKGSNNELTVAKILSEWAGTQFNRVPASGGLRWKADNNVTGDIVPPADVYFPFSVECKKVECDWELDKLLIQTSEIWTFWSQCCRDAARLYIEGITKTQKEPMLIFTKNRRQYMLMLRYKTLKTLIPHDINMFAHIKVTDGRDIVIIPLKLFLDKVSFDDIQRIGDSLNITLTQ